MSKQGNTAVEEMYSTQRICITHTVMENSTIGRIIKAKNEFLYGGDFELELNRLNAVLDSVAEERPGIVRVLINNQKQAIKKVCRELKNDTEACRKEIVQQLDEFLDYLVRKHNN